MTFKTLVAVLSVAGAVTASAQAPPVPSPRDTSTATIRGLTPREVEDLREGHGMGLARAAEENGYPGPRHLLDFAAAGALELAPDQVVALTELYATTSAQARGLGTRVLDEEQALEAAFRAGTIGERDLATRLSRLGALQAELRGVHLRAHLAARALLTAAQVERYDRLRGHHGAGHALHGRMP
jgi:hypothetical protein